MASIKDLRSGIALAVAATLGCSSGTPQQSSSCPVSGQLACPMPPSGAQMCTSVAMDNNNCGSCGVVCPTGKTCQNGVCAAPTCATGATPCNSVCTLTMTDKSNCGNCGVTCQGGKACVNGSCSCAPGSQECVTGTCSNLLTDPVHCGNCTTACSGATNLCSNGVCVANCPSGQTKCGNSCVVVTNDNANCGNCGVVCTGAQTCVNSVCTSPVVTGSGGSTSVGQGGTSSVGQGGVNPSSGGANPSNGGSAQGGVNTSIGGVGGTATGGVSTSSGGAATGGTSSVGGGAIGGAATGGTSANPNGGSAACSPAANVISDFEDTPGKGTLHPVPTSTTNGYWYTFKDTINCTTAQVPASVTGAAVNSEALATSDSRYGTCNRYAMHSTISGCATYSGFGAELHPASTDGKMKGAVDLSAYDGVSFWIKGGATSGPIYVEFQTTNCIDAANGGTAVSPKIDQFNCPGYLISKVPTTWTQMYVPFGITGLRWFPTSAAGGTTQCLATDYCEAPALVKSNIVDIQFALEDPFNVKPTPYSSYDVWIDDLALYKFSDTPANAGLATWTQTGNYAFPQDKSFAPNCTMPAGATGKLLQDAYVQWKAKFVVADGSNFRVISPEIDTGNPTVSEGMGYGMLIAVYMGDKPLFDGLLSYWKAHGSAQSMLMNWKIGGTGGANSATDADEDVAFALQMARKQWGTAYDADASLILSQFLAADVDGSGYLKPGNAFSDGTSLSNPSYFAPAFYKYFATVDTANAAKWTALATNCYTQLASITGSNGLVPAWCTSNCTARGGGGYVDATMYQYDSHRTPWRIALDACWNNEAKAKTYLNAVVGFFAGKAGAAGAAGGGLSSLGDIYDAAGAITANSARNSMSLVGCAGVGAMGSSATNAATFRDRTWTYLLEGHYTKNYMYTNGDTTTKAGYTYYNATVGLLTAMTMSGNFYVMQ